MGGRLHRRGAGALYRLSNKSFGFPQGWGVGSPIAKQMGETFTASGKPVEQIVRLGVFQGFRFMVRNPPNLSLAEFCQN